MEITLGEGLPADMTMDALRAEFVALAEPFTAIANRRSALSAEIAKREQAAHARSRVDAMSEEEKAALRAVLGDA